MTPSALEVNLDGLVGPTHNYAGLAYGNVASQRSRQTVSNPRKAALQGLRKMKLLADLGLVQAVLPPHDRPDIAALRRLGFRGNDAGVLAAALREAPQLLAACGSASSMWAANAATISPSADTADGRVHITPANLASHLHRSLEAPTTAVVLRKVFPDEALFAHHPPLDAAPPLYDEGAANHTRLSTAYGRPGLELFVYGQSARQRRASRPTTFPARQTLEASAAIARHHRLDPSSVLFVQQAPEAIDAGVFHNDVIAVGNLNVLLYHARAFVGRRKVLDDIHRWFDQLPGGGGEFVPIAVSEEQVPLSDAVASYLFNSQFVCLPRGGMALIAPAECRRTPATQRWLAALPGAASGTPIASVHFVDTRQSMKNGGGPACLRLRVVLTESELRHMHRGVLLTPALFDTLAAWINRHYRDRLRPADLGDPALLHESRAALDELTGILRLGSIYPFQH